MAESQQRLNEASALAERTHNDAEESRANAVREAARLVEEARQEAAHIIGEAKSTAERIRADSERELTAATQRRDSINAQLANVRQMLATLTGTAAMPLTAFGADEEEPADPVDELDDGDEVDQLDDEAEDDDGQLDDVAEDAEDREDSLAETKG
jgi:regulator of protease activity HflC (stomatin/prohibitin superfamily)